MKKNARWDTAIVSAVHDLTPTVRMFELTPAHGVVAWTPGSHINIAVTIEGAPDTRSYSLVGEPDPRVYRIAVKRAEPSRGGSAWMWRLVAGDEVRIANPENHFELGHDSPEYLLIAGGIGVTPLTSMVHALAMRGARLRLVYAARRPCELAFADDLRKMLGLRMQTFTDDAGEKIDFAAEFARLHPESEAYVCGPLGMLEAARDAWAAAGRVAHRLRYETFGASGHFRTEPFWVKVPRHNVEIRVGAEETLLDALTRAGVPVLSDCQRGECGLCALDVHEVQGRIDHRDVFFSSHERAANRRLCACVSRVVGGGLILDSAYRSDSPAL